MKLTDAIEGYVMHAESRRLAQGTISDYMNTLSRLAQYMGEAAEVEEIGKAEIEGFLRSLNGLKKKTVKNYHIGLSAFWTWLVKEGIVNDHVLRRVDAPRPEFVEIVPLSENDVKILLGSLERSKSYRTHGGTTTSHVLQNRLRNRMIILVLLDTGLRASEMCDLKLRDVDLANRRLRVVGKGSKERYVPLSSAGARKAIWAYLQKRADKGPNDNLVVSKEGMPMSRDGLGRLMRRIGSRAGVGDVHPHRFRHTFAIQYLRNQGDIFTLQRILGHSDLSMVKRYLAIAVHDTQRVHAMASPVSNWNL